MTERTVITTIEVTEVHKDIPDDAMLNKEERRMFIEYRVKQLLNADDVVVTNIQEFVRNNMENNNGWILCSDRLPEAYDNVFVCTEDGGRTIAHTTFEQPFCFFDMHNIEIDGGVIAWQPLSNLPAPLRKKVQNEY